MIEIQGLTKYYGRSEALRDVSFSVGSGEVVGFLGPNAAGKTTTLRILTGYLPATSGTAAVAGYDVFEDSLEVRRRIGYVPETVPLYPDMTVQSYLGYCARLRGVSRHERDERVDDAILKARLDDVADTIIGRLSKGFRQRVGIAQALVHDPPVLVLDEPTIGLDPLQIIETRQLIKDLGRDHTIILSSHILPEVSMICSRVVIINRGRIVAEDSAEGLTARVRSSSRLMLRLLRPGGDAAAVLAAISGVTGVRREDDSTFQVESKLDADVREQVARAAVERNWGLVELRPVELSLEDVFLHLTMEEEGIGAS
ncbi:MAG: ATP-binding cassette domain-containing protein [Armatimonadota bacterium]|nr:MAG: ATP-binding cassette domain-containing protein [Armatimonadota bacterium]